MTKSWLAVIVVSAIALLGYGRYDPAYSDAPTSATAASDALFASAFEKRTSNIDVEGQGTVEKLLPDDSDGSRHQRFIVRLNSGQTVLIAHNIDLAPRVAPLNEGDVVSFRGVYEWNEKGGVVHWTHRDPDGRRSSGWIKHNGKIFR